MCPTHNWGWVKRKRKKKIKKIETRRKTHTHCLTFHKAIIESFGVGMRQKKC